MAIELALRGWNIAIHYNSSHKEARSLQQQIQAAGQRCGLFQADLSSPDEVELLLPRVQKELGSVSLLINNSSVFEQGMIDRTDHQKMERIFQINFFAPFILHRAMSLQKSKGHIINMLDTKISGNKGKYAAYTLSRKSLTDLTAMAALQFAPKIRVNGIAPGFILLPEDQPPEYADQLLPGIPLARKGECAEITGAMNFLINNEYITGQILYLDGGSHLK